jgi:hypothetical protein
VPKPKTNAQSGAVVVDAALYARVFETHHEGALILEDLIRRFVRPPVSQGGIDAVLQTYDRAGQRRVPDYIVAMINRAHGVEDTNEEEVPE